MPTLPPIALPVFIVLAVAFTGAVIAFVRDRRRFSGYRDLTSDVLKLRKALDGDVFRDGEDLVLSGTWHGCPAQVRFSHGENTPGLNVRVGMRANFRLYLAPRSAKLTDGRYLVRTSDEMFNARVEARTDQPTEARMLLDARDVVPALNKLCRSSYDFLRLTNGMAELVELTPPTVDAVRFVPAQLDAMDTLARNVAKMPGAESVKVDPLKRERRYVLKLAIAAGVLATVAAVLIALNSGEVPAVPAARNAEDAVLPVDAAKVPGASKWRVAGENNFENEGVAWLRRNNQSISGRIAADFAGNGKIDGVAYILAAPNGDKRVVVLSRGTNAYDTRFKYIGLAARIPKAILNSIEWAGTPPVNPDGDGLLIVRTPNDRRSGLIIFTQGTRIISATPKDYLNIRLE
ncbi:MAG TPA: hypothetical protein VFM10_05035 [Terriglobales bacterium]|nr:hypothetical protein [Terriglobales bacterium]